MNALALGPTAFQKSSMNMAIAISKPKVATALFSCLLVSTKNITPQLQLRITPPGRYKRTRLLA